MRRIIATLVGAAALFSAVPSARQLPPFGGTDAFVADLSARRARLAGVLGPETVFVAWSAPARVYSTDVNYEYRQDSNLLYLSGIDQEDTILVIVPGARATKEILFTSEANARGELWNGHILTPAEVSSASGVRSVQPRASFDTFMHAMFAGTSAGPLADDLAAVADAVTKGTARLAILDRLPGAGRAGGGGGANATGATSAATSAAAAPTPAQAPAPAPMMAPEPGSHAAWAFQMRDAHPGLTPVSVAQDVTKLRQVKTPYEQRLLTKSVEISAEAHLEGMKAARPGRWEYEVEAAIEYWYLKNGAMSWGYPSIVGSGPNATTLHYEKSTRQMQNGDLLLVDAAANFQGLTGDITRTYPVNGKFTPAQRTIYELVLAAQEAGIAAAQPGAKSADITTVVRATFAAGLMKLGLISDAAQVSTWMPHGPTHGIGIDVHDPLGDLVPGAAFVIEPGLYFREDSFAGLGRNSGGRGAPPVDNAPLLATVRPVFEKYKGIGVRIEDSFLMTESGPVMLSSKAPRQIADIEKVVGKGQ